MLYIFVGWARTPNSIKMPIYSLCYLERCFVKKKLDSVHTAVTFSFYIGLGLRDHSTFKTRLSLSVMCCTICSLDGLYRSCCVMSLQNALICSYLSVCPSTRHNNLRNAEPFFNALPKCIDRFQFWLISSNYNGHSTWVSARVTEWGIPTQQLPFHSQSSTDRFWRARQSCNAMHIYVYVIYF